jgi:hypothetical protein
VSALVLLSAPSLDELELLSEPSLLELLPELDPSGSVPELVPLVALPPDVADPTDSVSEGIGSVVPTVPVVPVVGVVPVSPLVPGPVPVVGASQSPMHTFSRPPHAGPAIERNSPTAATALRFMGTNLVGVRAGTSAGAKARPRKDRARRDERAGLTAG